MTKITASIPKMTEGRAQIAPAKEMLNHFLFIAEMPPITAMIPRTPVQIEINTGTPISPYKKDPHKSPRGSRNNIIYPKIRKKSGKGREGGIMPANNNPPII